MRDVQLPIRTAYIQALKGEITTTTIGGQTVIVPVLDFVPQQQKEPYIHVKEQTVTSRQLSQACSEYEATILFEIVTSFIGNAGGRKQSDLIADQVLARIPAFLTVVGFQLGEVRVALDYSPPRDLDPTSTLYRRLIRFRNILYYNN